MKKIAIAILTFLIISLLINFFFVENLDADSGTTIYVDDDGGQDYIKIQDAIDNVSAEDTIYVYSGTYYENINIDKAITLTGQNRDNTIIDNNGDPDYDCVSINANNIEISGFTIQNSDYNGIGILNYDSCTVTDNKINGYGQYGIDIDGSDSNTINSNIISGGNYCIRFSDGSSYSILTENTFQNTDDSGIYIQSNCNNNEIYHNNFLDFNPPTTFCARDYGTNNVWDNGFPSGGNYWCDNTEVDERCGSNQYILGSDGIADSSYLVPYSSNHRDYYPFMNQNGWQDPPPIAEAGGPYSNEEGGSITFDGSGSTDSDGSVESYRWDWNYQGISNPSWDTSWSSSPTASHSYSTAGTYEVMLQVKDDDGFVNNDSATVTISEAENQPPNADAGRPYTGYVNVSLQVDGSGSSDSDGSIAGYKWDFENDGEWDTGWLTSSTTTHTYITSGFYTLKLQVKDNEGSTNNDTSSVTITAENIPPIADAGGPYKAKKRQDFTLDGSGSYDSDGSIVAYRWRFDHMSDTGWKSSPIITRATSYIGVITVTLDVKDNVGAISSDTTTITFYDCLEKHKPTPNANGPYTGYVNYTINFDYSGSKDECGIIESIRWDFGDGNFSSIVYPTHIYKKPGIYNVSLRIEDDDGEVGFDNTTANITELSINEIPPIADANGPYTAYVNETVSFDASNCNDSDGIIISYNWSFGDGNKGNGLNPTHTYFEIGNYSITLTITDDDGLISSDKTTIIIIEQEHNITYVGDMGYLIDNDSNGVYNFFYSNTTDDKTTVEKQNDNTYLIDNDGDGIWDYIYDPSTGETTSYQKEDKKDSTPGFEILLMILSIMIFEFLRRKKK